jgi:hypothetical protein
MLSQGYHDSRPSSRAPLAALLALIPGLGAVYNRQNLKAAVHFLGVVGSFQLTRVDALSGLFAASGLVFYLYSIIDAWRTAQSIALGESATKNEQRFKRSLVKAAPFVGAVLILTGILAVVQLINPFSISTLARLLPVALILLGGYLLTRYFRRTGDETSSPQDPSYSIKSPGAQASHSDRGMRLVGRGR